MNPFRKRWTGPSGLTYVYRGLNPFELSHAWGGIPMIGRPDPSKSEDMSGPVLELDMSQVRRVWMRMITVGVIQVLSPDEMADPAGAPKRRIVESADPRDPDSIPFDELGVDMTGLQKRIQDATIPPEEVGPVSSFRGEPGELRPASRDGEGVRPDSLVSDVGTSLAVDVQSDGVVSSA